MEVFHFRRCPTLICLVLRAVVPALLSVWLSPSSQQVAHATILFLGSLACGGVCYVRPPVAVPRLLHSCGITKHVANLWVTQLLGGEGNGMHRLRYEKSCMYEGQTQADPGTVDKMRALVAFLFEIQIYRFQKQRESNNILRIALLRAPGDSISRSPSPTYTGLPL